VHLLFCLAVIYKLIPELIGGLGDVAGSLPKALAKRGHRVMVTCYSLNELTALLNLGRKLAL